MPRIDGDGEVSSASDPYKDYQLEQERQAELARSQTAQATPPPAELRAEPTGSELSTEAVNTANRQQDRGEDWTRYANTTEREIPQSIEDKAKEAKDNELKTDEARQEVQRISAQDLLNQLQLQSGRFRG